LIIDGGFDSSNAAKDASRAFLALRRIAVAARVQARHGPFSQTDPFNTPYSKKVYMRTPIYFSLASILCSVLATATAHAADLTIEINLPSDRQGTVLAAVFDKAVGFPRGTALRTAMVQPVNGKAALRFTDLPKGEYAVTAFLDENSNAKLDTNLFGIPTELYGFSRNARGQTGPTTFAEAAFRVEESPQQQVFDLK
jgi:uncharacterized protein (DUF2141 family)